MKINRHDFWGWKNDLNPVLLPEFCFMEYLWPAVIKYWTRMFWLEIGANEGPHHYVELTWHWFAKRPSNTSALFCACILSTAISLSEEVEPRGWAFAPPLVVSPGPAGSYTHLPIPLPFQPPPLMWATVNWNTFPAMQSLWLCNRATRTCLPFASFLTHLIFKCDNLALLPYLLEDPCLFPPLPHFSSNPNSKSPSGLVWSVTCCKIFLLTKPGPWGFLSFGPTPDTTPFLCMHIVTTLT